MRVLRVSLSIFQNLEPVFSFRMTQTIQVSMVETFSCETIFLHYVRVDDPRRLVLYGRSSIDDLGRFE